MSTIIGRSRSEDNGSHWLSVSDLMAGLMMIFLFIAISYMRFVQVERDQIKDIVVAANDTHGAIYEALEGEFAQDLPRWNAELDRKSMTVRFKEPDVLFKQNSAELEPRFIEILNEFWPRYVETLAAFSDSIDEVRIEGHTSSEWRSETSPTDAYFLNMRLSQDRTRAVLEHCYGLPAVAGNHSWLKTRIAAVGLSSARLIQGEDGAEDKRRSRRVEFTVKTNFERRIIRSIVDDPSM